VREWVRVVVAQNAQEEGGKAKSGKEKRQWRDWRRTRNVKRLKASIFLSSFSSVVEGLACGNNKLYPCRVYCCNRSGVKGGRICCPSRRESMKSVPVEVENLQALRRGKSVPVQTWLRKNPYYIRSTGKQVACANPWSRSSYKYDVQYKKSRRCIQEGYVLGHMYIGTASHVLG